MRSDERKAKNRLIRFSHRFLVGYIYIYIYYMRKDLDIEGKIKL
jgi:hypothetical protein